MIKDLSEIRQEIDRVDRQLVALFEERMRLCEDVADYKLAHGKAVFDAKREAEKIAAVKELAHGAFNQHCAEELFRHLISISKKMQIQMIEERKKGEPSNTEWRKPEDRKTRIVYQGIPGAYGYQAMVGYFGTDDGSFYVDTFREAMKQVAEGNADYAILPMENSSAGIVGDVYDLLVEYDNYIVDSYDLPVRHSLLGVKGSSLSDIKKVCSHPQALAQCAKFLEGYPQWEQEKTLNTAVSAREIERRGDKTIAAIAGKINAKLYDLEVLREDIQNVNTNTTRFVVIQKHPQFKKDSTRICVSFEVKHESGSLYYALSNVIYNDINMTKIESRPIPERPFQYRFFVELEGNPELPEIKNALRGMEEETVSFRILGNY